MRSWLPWRLPAELYCCYSRRNGGRCCRWGEERPVRATILAWDDFRRGSHDHTKMSSYQQCVGGNVSIKNSNERTGKWCKSTATTVASDVSNCIEVGTIVYSSYHSTDAFHWRFELVTAQKKRARTPTWAILGDDPHAWNDETNKEGLLEVNKVTEAISRSDCVLKCTAYVLSVP